MATTFILTVITIMHKFNWYAKPITSQILKVQIENTLDFEKIFDDIFVKYTL
jgi:virulence-associated protein VapD